MKMSKGTFTLTDDSGAIDIDFVESMLRDSYWAANRPRAAIEESIGSSLNFSVFCGRAQVGYARVVTDAVTFAWIADVVVDPEFRGGGLGQWIMACVLEHPSVSPTTQKLLRTRDAHGLYAKFGFEVAECMARLDPN